MSQYQPGPTASTVRDSQGKLVTPPADWTLVPPGDAALTRRVKAAGPHWVVVERRGRRNFSRGVWANQASVARIRSELEQERSKPSYEKRKLAAQQRRLREQDQYVREFREAVLRFLDFRYEHNNLATQIAIAVSTQATPVGSGTVARTKRISIESRAEAAVIAWMRHQTTVYDSMKIARVKGQRREVRRMLARQSREVLDRYRSATVIPKNCPLKAWEESRSSEKVS